MIIEEKNLKTHFFCNTKRNKKCYKKIKKHDKNVLQLIFLKNILFNFV